MFPFSLLTGLILGLALALDYGSATTESKPAEPSPPAPVTVDPALRSNESGLKPGLSVSYFRDIFVRHIDKLIAHAADEPGQPGPPIGQLNHQFERNPLFDSGSNRGVGMRMEGYLHFDIPGTYALQALSNDGIRILVGRKQILEDPGVHGDQLSPAGEVTVMKPGWYPLTIWYFQRKGTAALKLFWLPPGRDTQQIVPAEALAHAPSPEAE